MKRFRNMFLFVLLLSSFLLVACSNDAETPVESDEDNGDEASDYPSESFTMLVGYSPGGGTDTNARTMIKTLNDNGIIEQSFQVENIPGPSGIRAYTELLQDPDNPYNLMDVSDIGIPLYNGSLEGHSLDDFKPIAQVASGTLAMMVNIDSEYDDVEELLANMLEDPSSVIIPVSGALDSSEPFAWYNIFEALHGEPVNLGELNLVPMEGTSETVNAILGGHGDVALVNPGNAVDYVEAGDAKVLAVLSDERAELFPDVPTLVEKDIDFTYYRTRSWWLGGGVSDDVVKFWEGKLKEAVETDDWKEHIKNTNQDVNFMGTDEYLEYLEREGPIFGDYIDMVQEHR